MVSFQE